MATLKYFIGLDSEPRPQAIFFLTIFGLSCDDIATHYEKPNTLSHYKMNILERCQDANVLTVSGNPATFLTNTFYPPGKYNMHC